MKKSFFVRSILIVFLVFALSIPCNVLAESFFYRAYVPGADSVHLGRADIRYSLWWYTDANTNKRSTLPSDAVVEIFSPVKGVTYTAMIAYWKGTSIEKNIYKFKSRKSDEYVAPFSISLNDIKTRKGKKAILRIVVKAKKGKKSKSFESLCYIENDKLVSRNTYK